MHEQHSCLSKKRPVGISERVGRIDARALPDCARAAEDQRAAEWYDLFRSEGLDLRDVSVARSAFLVVAVLDEQMTTAIASLERRLPPEFETVCVSIVATLNALAQFVQN